MVVAELALARVTAPSLLLRLERLAHRAPVDPCIELVAISQLRPALENAHDHVLRDLPRLLPRSEHRDGRAGRQRQRTQRDMVAISNNASFRHVLLLA